MISNSDGIAVLRRAGARLLLPEDEEYPASLKAVPAPPPFLLAQLLFRLLEDLIGSLELSNAADHWIHQLNFAMR